MSNKVNPLPEEMIREALELDPLSRTWLRWKTRPLHHFKNSHGMNIWNSQNSGKEAGTEVTGGREKGYWQIVMNGKFYRAHRVVYFLSRGSAPAERLIDHIDNNGQNNNPENLRLATNSQNLMNRGATKKNRSGRKGVSATKYGKWRARIFVNKQEILLGVFDDPDEAAAAYKKAALHYFGEFGWSKIRVTGPSA